MTATASASASDTVDIMLDVSAVVISTLKNVSLIPPVPFLSDAAGIAVTIIGVVQVCFVFPVAVYFSNVDGMCRKRGVIRAGLRS